MARLDEVVGALDRELEAAPQADFCPNGLQVEGRGEVTRVVVGVTACLELFEAARVRRAELVVVHHGIFWNGWEPRIKGAMRRRLVALLDAGISLAAYHLPLDRHPVLGNNAQIADRLGLSDRTGIAPYRGVPVGMIGNLAEPVPAHRFEARVAEVFGTAPRVFPFGPETVRRVAVLSGKGDHDLPAAIDAGADAYLTGEAGVSTRETAREAGIHYLAAGHHATERFGVMALGKFLEERFGLPWDFVEVENPV